MMEQARANSVLNPADAPLLDHYRLDDTLEMPPYPLRREREMSSKLAVRLSRFWERWSSRRRVDPSRKERFCTRCEPRIARCMRFFIFGIWI